jgi:hypothetical protein
MSTNTKEDVSSTIRVQGCTKQETSMKKAASSSIELHAISKRCQLTFIILLFP